MTVDGVVVLEGRGLTDTTQIKGKPLKRESGHYTFTAKYRSLADVPARLQLWWEGEAFAREPLPAWRFGHRNADVPTAVKADQAAAAGRDAARTLGCAGVTRARSRPSPTRRRGRRSRTPHAGSAKPG